MENDSTKVSVTLGYTLNLGNFQSLRLDLGVVDNKGFIVQHGGKDGYIIYRNGFYLFQPLELIDLSVPIALRVARLPVKRDMYVPSATVAVAAAEATEATEAKETIIGLDAEHICSSLSAIAASDSSAKPLASFQ